MCLHTTGLQQPATLASLVRLNQPVANHRGSSNHLIIYCSTMKFLIELIDGANFIL